MKPVSPLLMGRGLRVLRPSFVFLLRACTAHILNNRRTQVLGHGQRGLASSHDHSAAPVFMCHLVNVSSAQTTTVYERECTAFARACRYHCAVLVDQEFCVKVPFDVASEMGLQVRPYRTSVWAVHINLGHHLKLHAYALGIFVDLCIGSAWKIARMGDGMGWGAWTCSRITLRSPKIVERLEYTLAHIQACTSALEHRIDCKETPRSENHNAPVGHGVRPSPHTRWWSCLRKSPRW